MPYKKGSLIENITITSAGVKNKWNERAKNKLEFFITESPVWSL
jgi:hypothetical protein